MAGDAIGSSTTFPTTSRGSGKDLKAGGAAGTARTRMYGSGSRGTRLAGSVVEIQAQHRLPLPE